MTVTPAHAARMDPGELARAARTSGGRLMADPYTEGGDIDADVIALVDAARALQGASAQLTERLKVTRGLHPVNGTGRGQQLGRARLAAESSVRNLALAARWMGNASNPTAAQQNALAQNAYTDALAQQATTAAAIAASEA